MLRAMLITVLLFSPLVNDNFNDGVVDSGLWTTGAGFANDSFNFFSSVVSADESSGKLVFTHPGSFRFGTYNAYASNASFNLRDSRASALVNVEDGAWVYLAIGYDARHMARIGAQKLGDGLVYVTCEVWDGEGHRTLNPCIPGSRYDTLSKYLAIRVNGSKIIFESSPDGSTWTPHLTVKAVQFTANDLRVEIGGGGFFPDAGVHSGWVDDFQLEQLN